MIGKIGSEVNISVVFIFISEIFNPGKVQSSLEFGADLMPGALYH